MKRPRGIDTGACSMKTGDYPATKSVQWWWQLEIIERWPVLGRLTLAAPPSPGRSRFESRTLPTSRHPPERGRRSSAPVPTCLSVLLAAEAMSAVTLPASAASSSSEDFICSVVRCARSRSNDVSISERRSRNPAEIFEINSEADCSSRETSPLRRAAAASSSALADPARPKAERT